MRVPIAEAAIFAVHAGDGVERITGIPKEQFLKAVDMFTSDPQRRRHEESRRRLFTRSAGRSTRFGTQIIRTAAMIQLLLGNVGRAGGGVNALRGHSNIQGATDMAGIFDILPGYLKMPNPNDADLATYLKRTTPTSSKPTAWDSFNYWSNTPKFAVSLLKALYGDAATKQNDFAFNYLPKDRPELFLDADLGPDVPRQREGNVRVRNERRDDRARHAEKYRCAEESGLARGGRNLSG